MAARFHLGQCRARPFPDHDRHIGRVAQPGQHPLGAQPGQCGKGVEQSVGPRRIHRDHQGGAVGLFQHPMGRALTPIKPQAPQIAQGHSATAQGAKIGNLPLVHLNRTHAATRATKPAPLQPNHDQGPCPDQQHRGNHSQQPPWPHQPPQGQHGKSGPDQNFTPAPKRGRCFRSDETHVLPSILVGVFRWATRYCPIC